MGPHAIITNAYDWSPASNPYSNWTDEVNALWWPRGGDTFASCLLLIDDHRHELLKAMVQVQVAAARGDDDLIDIIQGTSSVSDQLQTFDQDDPSDLTFGSDLEEAIISAGLPPTAGILNASYRSQLVADFSTTIANLITAASTSHSSTATRPYIILQAMMAPKEGAKGPETDDACGLTDLDVSEFMETEKVAWKLYPLPPVRLPNPDDSDALRGLWILPLVDIRYFWRLGPIGSDDAGSGSTQTAWPIGHVDSAEDADWMPPLRAYPDDVDEPANYVEIDGNGTHPGISPTDNRGHAADIQAAMQNWRIVCRDVRTNWNCTPITGTPHTEFTGILADYPDDPDATESYHLDAIRLAGVEGNLISGGLSDSDVVQDLISRKIRVLFGIASGGRTYEVDIYQNQEDPTTTADLTFDDNGPTDAEKIHLPKAFLGIELANGDPDDDKLLELIGAAKRWSLLYYLWRRKQAYYKFPGIAPVVPNGYSSVIRWSFSASDSSTTYVAVDRYAGTGDDPPGSDSGAAGGGPGGGGGGGGDCIWIQLIEEGLGQDDQEAWYGWREMEEDGAGGFQVKSGGRTGEITVDPARCSSLKQAVPLGIVVEACRGADIAIGSTNTNVWWFKTPDLDQDILCTGIPSGGNTCESENGTEDLPSDWATGFVTKYNPQEYSWFRKGACFLKHMNDLNLVSGIRYRGHHCGFSVCGDPVYTTSDCCDNIDPNNVSDGDSGTGPHPRDRWTGPPPPPPPPNLLLGPSACNCPSSPLTINITFVSTCPMLNGLTVTVGPNGVADSASGNRSTGSYFVAWYMSDQCAFEVTVYPGPGSTGTPCSVIVLYPLNASICDDWIQFGTANLSTTPGDCGCEGAAFDYVVYP